MSMGWYQQNIHEIFAQLCTSEHDLGSPARIRLRLDDDGGADFNQVEHSSDVGVAHTHAAVGNSLAQQVFPWGAVKPDEILAVRPKSDPAFTESTFGAGVTQLPAPRIFPGRIAHHLNNLETSCGGLPASLADGDAVTDQNLISILHVDPALAQFQDQAPVHDQGSGARLPDSGGRGLGRLTRLDPGRRLRRDAHRLSRGALGWDHRQEKDRPPGKGKENGEEESFG